jgi:transcriptional regulator
MYIPKNFAEDDPEILAGLMQDASFATLLTSRDGVPLGSHIPLHLDQSEGQPGRLLGHLARANDHWRDFDGETEALAIFHGPHAYISPNWYETPNMVPTWNYAAVHAYGTPRIIENAEQTLGILNQLVEANESEATGNWSMQTPDADILRGMLKGIVAFEMPINRLEGKWKMSQNRKPQDARGAAEGLRQAGNPEAQAVASAMEARIEP